LRRPSCVHPHSLLESLPQEAQHHGVYLRPLLQALLQVLPASQGPKRRLRGLGRFTVAFRAAYYQLARRVLAEKRQVIPCYAGWASAHIAPNGDVWTCCVRADPVGNLRQTAYDLRPIWFEQVGRLRELRRSIRAQECACPMANASYANMLLHPPTLLRVARDVLRR